MSGPGRLACECCARKNEEGWYRFIRGSPKGLFTKSGQHNVSVPQQEESGLLELLDTTKELSLILHTVAPYVHIVHTYSVTYSMHIHTCTYSIPLPSLAQFESRMREK